MAVSVCRTQAIDTVPLITSSRKSLILHILQCDGYCTFASITVSWYGQSESFATCGGRFENGSTSVQHLNLRHLCIKDVINGVTNATNSCFIDNKLSVVEVEMYL